MSKQAILIGASVAIAFVAGISVAHAQQAPYKAPRTSFGAPDLQGNWTNVSLTPLERSAELGDRKAMTPDEVARAEGERQEILRLGAQPLAADVDLKDVPCYARNTKVVRQNDVCGYGQQWMQHGDRVMRVGGEPRTSLITFPSNGRIPPFVPGHKPRRTPGGRIASSNVNAESGPAGRADNVEERSLGDRCITSFGNHAGPVMLPYSYNNNYSIVQAPDHVAILVEMVHDVRIVPLSSKHGALPKWYGDSIGRYEGDTLVVETISYHPLTSFRGSDKNLKVTERFTRVGPERLKYEFKVEDPTVWVQPWGGEYEFSPADGPIYEYACHEGNYALGGILAGARREEAKASNGVTTAER